MKISVIIPTFNIENQIADCLESLIKQTISNNLFEIIIVDDCSTDNTFKVVKSYSEKEKNLFCYRLNKRGGPGIARNYGVASAKGEFIIFLDGDDLLPHYALESLLNAAGRHQADVVTFNWAYTDNMSRAQRRDLSYFPEDKQELIKLYLSMNFDGSVIYTMVTKKLLDDNMIRFPTGLHEDISVIFKIYYCSKKILREDKIMYLKRKRSGSIVNTISPEHIDGYFSSWPNIKKFLIDKESANFVEKCMFHYMKGVTGLTACALLKNMAINESRHWERKKIYSYIYERMQHYFSSEIRKYSLPNETRYDKLASCFYKAFRENHSQAELATTTFESETINLNLGI